MIKKFHYLSDLPTIMSIKNCSDLNDSSTDGNVRLDLESVMICV